MATLFGGRPAADPLTLLRACQDASPPLPTGWWNKANLFRNPLGRGPGTGAVLLTRADLDALDLTADHELKFLDDRRPNAPVVLKRITLLRAECLTPGYRDDPRATYLCELADRRWHLARVPTDRAFNVTNAAGDGYLTPTTNGGTAWTWAGVVGELWADLGLGTAPALPFTPDGTPENLRFHQAPAWEAVNDVLDRIACAPFLDHTTDTFSFVRLGDTAGASATALAAELATLDRDGKRTWDAYHREPDRGRLPEKVRVVFPRRPWPTDGTSWYYAVDVTLAATAGVVAGTFVKLRDDLTALGSGTPTNAAALATRAAERAADWRRKRLGFERRLTVVYRDFRAALRPGEAVGAAALDDRGGVMATELDAGPDGALERWRPWEPATAFAGDAAADDCGVQFMGRDELDCFEARIPAQGEGACANVTATSSNLRLAWDAGDSRYESSTTVATAAGATTLVMTIPESGEPAVRLVASGVDVDGRFVGCVDGWRRYAFYSTDLCGEAPVLDCASCPGGAPRHFTFSFAGGTGDVAPLNSTTWNIPYLGGFCLWRDTKTPGQSVTTNPTASLDMSTRTLTLYPTGTLGGESLTYTLDDATDCCGPLTATQTGSSGISGTYPSTLTLTPVGPCVRTRCQTHVFYVDLKCGDCPLVPTACCSDGGFPSSLCVTLRANGSCNLSSITEVQRSLPYRGLIDGKHTWYTDLIRPIDDWCGLSDGGVITGEEKWFFVVFCDGTHMQYDLVLILDGGSVYGGTSAYYSAIATNMALAGTKRFISATNYARLIDTSSPACDDDAILADDGTALYGLWHDLALNTSPGGEGRAFPSSGDVSWKLTKGACGGEAPAAMMMMAMAAPGGAALPCCGDRDPWPARSPAEAPA